MPDHKLIATKSQRYGTRMLTAGSPLVLDGPLARLYNALGAVRKPTRAEIATHWPRSDATTAPPAAPPTAPKARKRTAKKGAVPAMTTGRTKAPK